MDYYKLISKYTDLIVKVSVPRDKINDYKWVSENIVEYNKYYNENAIKIQSIAQELITEHGV